MKKVLSILLSICMLITVVSVFPVTVSAAATIESETQLGESKTTDDDGHWYIEGTDGDWEYTVSDDGSVQINGYKGTKKEITLPQTVNGRAVDTLGRRRASYCGFKANSVEVLNIPANVTKINCYRFETKNLKSIVVDSENPKLSSVDGVLFSKGKWVLYMYPPAKTGTDYKIPSTVKRIGDYAFDDAPLQSVTIPGTVAEIGEWALSGLQISSLTIPSSVEKIGNNAFVSNKSLTSVVLSDGIKSIEGVDIFSGCDLLKTIKIPASVETIAEGAFSNIDNLKEFIVDSANKNYLSYGGNLYTKDKTVLLARPLGKTNTSFTVPSFVKRIGYMAFMCSSSYLSEVIISEGVEEIGQSAFQGCTSMKTCKLPSTLKKFEEKAFTACYELRQINVPDGITALPDSLFSYCNMLESVTLSKNLTSIGADVFKSCDSLKNIELPNGLQSIGEKAFYYGGITKIKIPDTVTIIGEHAFYGCTELTSVTLSNSMEKIEYYLFAESGISEITIPDSVTCIDTYAFLNCSKLSKVTLSKNLKSIYSGAFSNCTSLKSITLPDGIEYIGWGAFNNCGLKSVKIPLSVITMFDDAFGFIDYATKLDDFTYYGYSGTVADKVAKTNGFKFVSMGEFLLGDNDLNNQIDIKDVTTLQRILTDVFTLDNLRRNTLKRNLADVNGDGYINIKDATEIQKYIAGISIEYKIGQPFRY